MPSSEVDFTRASEDGRRQNDRKQMRQLAERVRLIP
jgi:hypothetical protein